ncbi:hypothetical protein BX600DRAFT_219347 [Xylariales sp. PMI_506]|nr:hypothetical protein BX600DRAFT_219347 [Xylariales sp. PMI_506]
MHCKIVRHSPCKRLVALPSRSPKLWATATRYLRLGAEHSNPRVGGRKKARNGSTVLLFARARYWHRSGSSRRPALHGTTGEQSPKPRPQLCPISMLQLRLVALVIGDYFDRFNWLTTDIYTHLYLRPPCPLCLSYRKMFLGCIPASCCSL